VQREAERDARAIVSEPELTLLNLKLPPGVKDASSVSKARVKPIALSPDLYGTGSSLATAPKNGVFYAFSLSNDIRQILREDDWSRTFN